MTIATELLERLEIEFHRTTSVHKEFDPQSQTVNAAYYVDVLEILQRRIVVSSEIGTIWELRHERSPILVDRSHPKRHDEGPCRGAR